jgi:putative transposase
MVQKNVARKNFDVVILNGTRGYGGTAFMLPLDQVMDRAPLENRIRWYEEQANPDRKVNANLVSYWAVYGEEGLRELAMRQQAVRAVEGIRAVGGRRMTAAMQETAIHYGVTLRTLYRWEADYKAEGLPGLMRPLQRSDKGDFRTMCRLARDYTERGICHASKQPQNLIMQRLQELADDLGEEACAACPYCEGSPARNDLKEEERSEYPVCADAKGRMIVPANRYAVNRFVQTIPEQQKVYAQFGSRRWEADFMHKTKRDKPLRVNECWFGDHHEFDLFVLDESGNVVRPWLTAWMDALTGRFVGWCLTLNPNSDTIAESFCRAAVYTVDSDMTGLPCSIYIDNGKDYRSLRFEGTKGIAVEFGKLNADFYAKKGMLQNLGVQVVHAIPYRAWSKTIERAFGILERRWVKEFPGWCGNSPANRPQDLDRELKRLKNQGKLMTFETFAKCFMERVLPEYDAYAGEDGMSPAQLYAMHEKARQDIPSWETMALLKSMQEERAVYPQGIRFNNMIYWHPALSDYIRAEEKVAVLYNRGWNPSITVMYKNRFICEATPIESLPIVGADKEKIAAHMEEQGKQRQKVTGRLAYLGPTEKPKKLDTERLSRGFGFPIN